MSRFDIGFPEVSISSQPRIDSIKLGGSRAENTSRSDKKTNNIAMKFFKFIAAGLSNVSSKVKSLAQRIVRVLKNLMSKQSKIESKSTLVAPETKQSPLALEAPAKQLAIDGTTPLLALEAPAKQLAIDGKKPLLALEAPKESLEEVIDDSEENIDTEAVKEIKSEEALVYLEETVINSEENIDAEAVKEIKSEEAPVYLEETVINSEFMVAAGVTVAVTAGILMTNFGLTGTLNGELSSPILTSV